MKSATCLRAAVIWLSTTSSSTRRAVTAVDSPSRVRWDSSCSRWMAKRRDRAIDLPDRGAPQDTLAELKRLRRENEILRQERDILKQATAFFAREGSR